MEDTIEGLESRVGELANAYLDVRVKTSGPVFGLADQVRSMLPDAVLVQATYDRLESLPALDRDPDSSLTDLYSQFHESPLGHSVPAPPALLDAMRALEDEVLRAAS